MTRGISNIESRIEVEVKAATQSAQRDWRLELQAALHFSFRQLLRFSSLSLSPPSGSSSRCQFVFHCHFQNHVPSCRSSARPRARRGPWPGQQTIDKHRSDAEIAKLEEYRCPLGSGWWCHLLLQHEQRFLGDAVLYAVTYPFFLCLIAEFRNCRITTQWLVGALLTISRALVSILNRSSNDEPEASPATLDSITPKIRQERAAAQAQPKEGQSKAAPDSEKVALEGGVDLSETQEEASQEAAFNPETGEINWDCPCLGGMAHGPCGEEFKAAFSCFVYSQEEPKGMDCIEKFKYV